MRSRAKVLVTLAFYNYLIKALDTVGVDSSKERTNFRVCKTDDAIVWPLFIQRRKIKIAETARPRSKKGLAHNRKPSWKKENFRVQSRQLLGRALRSECK